MFGLVHLIPIASLAGSALAHRKYANLLISFSTPFIVLWRVERDASVVIVYNVFSFLSHCYATSMLLYIYILASMDERCAAPRFEYVQTVEYNASKVLSQGEKYVITCKFQNKNVKNMLFCWTWMMLRVMGNTWLKLILFWNIYIYNSVLSLIFAYNCVAEQ